MARRPPRCKRPHQLFPYTTVFRSKPPPLFFARTEIGLLVARLPRAMTIDRFNRLCRHSAKCRPISWNWRPIRKLGRYPAQVHHIRECAHRISTPREADQNDAIARLIVGNALGVAEIGRHTSELK